MRTPVASTSNAAPAVSEHTNAFARLLGNDGNPPKLSRAQIGSYLEDNRRSAESLLAAFHLDDDRSLLQEAVEKCPNDPCINFAGWVASRRNDEGSAEERRRWLEAFKKSAPDNALADYLPAQEYFKAGQGDRAVQELIAASGKSRFQDYAAEQVQNLEEAYRSAGCSEAEAKAAASYDLSLPQLSDLKHLSENLRNLAGLYRQAGDEPSAQAALELGLQMGRRLGEAAQGASLITQIGTATGIQRNLFSAMDPNAPYGPGGQTVQDQLSALGQYASSWKGLWKQADPILQTMSDQELIGYFDRMKTLGELEALRWVVNRQETH